MSSETDGAPESPRRQDHGRRLREYRYDGFISYSHALDGRLAPAVQRGLARFAKSWRRARALRIFRDETSLSANPARDPPIRLERPP